MAALCLCLSLAGPPAGAATDHVDGISDQSMPAWDGAFPASPLGGLFGEVLAAGPREQLGFARYVVQWNASSQPSSGPNPGGDYRERFEAWLTDVRELGLTALVALTSYDGVYPQSTGSYARGLEGILDAGLALGQPIAYIEPWNEPNNQGRRSAVQAAELANAANALCETLHDCSVVAGGFEDSPDLPRYELAYERALTFTPAAWGVHPYAAIRAHDDASVRRFKDELPAQGRGPQIWLTEVAAFYCRRGEVLGERRQAGDASYLLHGLIADPAVAATHVFYYGLMYADDRPAPCAHGGGYDSELYGPGDRPRAAAAVLFPAAGPRSSPLFGPSPAGRAGPANRAPRAAQAVVATISAISSRRSWLAS